VIHYYWLVKADSPPTAYLRGDLAVLLAYRLGNGEAETGSGASCGCASKCIIAPPTLGYAPAKITSVRPENNACHDTLTSKADSKVEVIHG